MPSTFSESAILDCLIYITDEETKTTTSYPPVADLKWAIVKTDWEDTDFKWEFDETTVTEGWRFAISSSSNYINITILQTSGLKEGSRYTLEIKDDNDLVIFRDTIMVVSGTEKAKVYSYPNAYQQYDDGADSYIVI